MAETIEQMRIRLQICDLSEDEVAEIRARLFEAERAAAEAAEDDTAPAANRQFGFHDRLRAAQKSSDCALIEQHQGN